MAISEGSGGGGGGKGQESPWKEERKFADLNVRKEVVANKGKVNVMGTWRTGGLPVSLLRSRHPGPVLFPAPERHCAFGLLLCPWCLEHSWLQS